jgi:hypothetical protein
VALLTLAQLKAFLGDPPAAGDARLQLILDMAIAKVRTIAKKRGTLVGTAARTFSRLTSFTDDYGRSVIVLPTWPMLAAGPAPVVKDADGVVVTASNYTLDARAARIQGISTFAFDLTPFEVTATVGLGTDPDYATDIEPVINEVIRDVAADAYWHDNPNATVISEAGVSVSHGTYLYPASEGLPARAWETLNHVLPSRARIS